MPSNKRVNKPIIPTDAYGELNIHLRRCEEDLDRLRTAYDAEDFSRLANTAQDAKRSLDVVTDAARAMAVDLVRQKGRAGRIGRN